MTRRAIPQTLGSGCVLALFLLQGCAQREGGVFGFLNSRVKDALEMVDVGITVTTTPQWTLYAALLSSTPVGSGDVDGYFVGVGGGDIGVMRIRYNHIGLGVWGRERVGWGDGLLFDFGGFDEDKPETMNCQGVGPLGFLLPPYDRRPAGAPT
jgi:hypothetical protein